MASKVTIKYKGHSIDLPVDNQTLLKRLVEQVCAAYGLGPAYKYVLRHKNVEFPQSQYGVRGLPRGEALTLAPANVPEGPLNVTLGVGLPEGGRVIKQFSPDTTLWDLLVAIEGESDGKINLTHCYKSDPTSSRVFGLKKKSQQPAAYLNPIVIISNYEYGVNESLKDITLESIGVYFGRVAIRVVHRQLAASDPPSSESAPQAAPQEGPGPANTTSSEAAVAPAASAEAAEAEASSQGDTKPAVKGDRDGEQSNNNDNSDSDGPLDRGIRVFDAPRHTGDLSLSNRFELPESFYELTSSELRFILSQQTAKAKAEAGFKLQADREREEQKKIQKRLQRFPKTCIRLRFVDGVQIQATFMTTEKVGELYRFVESILTTQNTGFTLYISPPKRSLDDAKGATFFDKMLYPACVVHVQLPSGTGAKTAFAPEYLQRIEPHPSDQTAERGQADTAASAATSTRSKSDKGKAGDTADSAPQDKKSKMMNALLKVLKRH